MDILLVLIGSILVVVGLAGCVLPSLPGPPISFAALIVLNFSDNVSFGLNFFIIFGIITAAVLILDYVVPSIGGKLFGVSKYGIWGSVIGMIAGIILFPPFGMIIGVIVGAIAGELIAGKEHSEAMRAGTAAFFLSILMIAVKLALSVVMSYYFVKEVVKMLL